MKYTHRYSPKIQAHRLGDAAPEWVADLLAARQVIVNEEKEGDPVYSVPVMILSGAVASKSYSGKNGDYLLFDGNEVVIMQKDEFEAQYDPIDESTSTEDRKFVDTNAPVLVGTGVITKDEMEKLLNDSVKGAILIGNPVSRRMFFPAIIAIDYNSGRVIYDRDTLVDIVYKHSDGGTWDDADEHVSYNIERSLESMTNDENRQHMPLIVAKQECY